jgi:hypothetical protein
MIRLISAFALGALLAACGADGEPIQPTANLGVGVSSSGVSAGASVGVRRGPVAINVSVF